MFDVQTKLLKKDVFEYLLDLEIKKAMRYQYFFSLLIIEPDLREGIYNEADIIKARNPKAKIIVHKDYGLPNVSDEVLRGSLTILSSYSGNTEEVLAAFDECLEKKLNFAVICSGGKLMARAEKNDIPYIQIPPTGIQPRHALGFNLVANE